MAKEKRLRKKKQENLFKRWVKLANPSPGIWFLQILFYVLYVVFLTLQAFFAAFVIDNLYNKNWTMALVWLAVELSTIVLRNVFYHIQYKFYCKHMKHIRHNVGQKIYNKILTSETSSLNELTKEKLLNITSSNIGTLYDFPDNIASYISYSIQVLITLVTVFTANLYAGLIVSALGVLNCFAYFKFNQKLAARQLKKHQQKDVVFQAYSKGVDDKFLIKEFNKKEEYEKDFLKTIDKYSDVFTNYYMLSSCKTNLWFAFYNVIIYAIVAILILFVSKGSLDIAIYLIIVPYLTTCTEKLCKVFEGTYVIENLRVDVDRVNIILEMNDKEFISYGNLHIKTDTYNLSLLNVSYENSNKKDLNYGKITKINMNFGMNGINVIKGVPGCGKRQVFNMIRRNIKPNDGKILLDGLDLYEYNPKTFNNHIYYAPSHPVFIKGTIMDNFRMVEKNKTKIMQICEELKIAKWITSLEKGYYTNIEEIKSEGKQFLLGLARALMYKSKILMIYEVPDDESEEFNLYIKNFLKQYSGDKTIIVFTHSNIYDNMANVLYEMEKGKIVNVINKNS